MTSTEKLKKELDTLKGIEESIKVTGGPSTMSDLLALLNKIGVKLINATGQEISFVDTAGNVISTYEPAKPAISTQYKINGCCYLVTEETLQSLKLIIPSIEILGTAQAMMVALPKEPVYVGDNNPFTPNKLIGYKWIEAHSIEFKK